ncbi:MAG: tetratricopeptide repeat protein, partial [Bacteroidales bacterium]|nr:tetratricopeptide repeat protein [Bacteroidales bacterium]
MKIFHWIIAFLILNVSIFSQSLFCAEDQEMDTLLAQLSNSKEDTTKINLLIKLSESTSWSVIKFSEKYARQALQLSQQISYEKGLAYSKFRLALVFISFDFKLTEELILESLEHAQHLQDSLLIARIYNAIGVLKYNLKEPDDALSYYNKSLQIYIDHNQDSLTAGVYNNLANIYNELSNDSLSKAYYLKAAEINSRTKNFVWLAINYANIGYDLTNKGKLEEGYSYLTKSLDIAKNNNFPRLLPAIYNNISHYYFKKFDYTESIVYAKLALKIARDQVNRLKEREALGNLKDAYFKENDLLNAFKYAELISKVNDSINKYNKLKELDLLEMRYKFEEERKAQKLERELLEAKHSRKELIYILIILGAGLVIITIVFLYMLQHNRIRRKSLEQKTILLEKENISKELEIRNKELTTNVMYSIQKNKVLTELTEELVEIEKTAVKEETRKAIHKISKKIHKSVDANAWEEFEIRFQQVHTEFYETLAAKHT